MSEFFVKLDDCYEERTFLNKLNVNFKNINAKNMLLDRSLKIFKADRKIYALFNVTPIILNFPLYSSGLMVLLWFGINLAFGKNPYFLLIASGIFLLLALFWTKYFYYFMLKRSMKKHKIKSMELI